MENLEKIVATHHFLEGLNKDFIEQILCWVQQETNYLLKVKIQLHQIYC